MMPEMHSILTYKYFGIRLSRMAYGPFAKSKKRIQTLKKIRDLRFVYQKELIKACFQHDMTYGDYKDLPI